MQGFSQAERYLRYLDKIMSDRQTSEKLTTWGIQKAKKARLVNQKKTLLYIQWDSVFLVLLSIYFPQDSLFQLCLLYPNQFINFARNTLSYISKLQEAILNYPRVNTTKTFVLTKSGDCVFKKFNNYDKIPSYTYFTLTLTYKLLQKVDTKPRKRVEYLLVSFTQILFLGPQLIFLFCFVFVMISVCPLCQHCVYNSISSYHF